VQSDSYCDNSNHVILEYDCNTDSNIIVLVLIDNSTENNRAEIPTTTIAPPITTPLTSRNFQAKKLPGVWGLVGCLIMAEKRPKKVEPRS
jgi:hypothetical protein